MKWQDIKLSHLMSFILVVETISFSVADSTYYVPHSVIAHNIKALEEELNYKRLIRSSRDINLT